MNSCFAIFTFETDVYSFSMPNIESFLKIPCFPPVITLDQIDLTGSRRKQFSTTPDSLDRLILEPEGHMKQK